MAISIDEIAGIERHEMMNEEPCSGREKESGSAEDCGETVAADSLTERFEEAERERMQFKALAQRVQADFSNYRRRIEEEKNDQYQNAKVETILEFLPIIDDLYRVLNHGATTMVELDESWLEGVRLVARKFESTVEGFGIELIVTEDREFDPAEHEIISYREASDRSEGAILTVVQKGYKLNGRVLRPALVIVAKKDSKIVIDEENPSDNSCETKEA